MSVPSVDAIDVTTGALRPDLAGLTPAQMAALVKPLPALVAVPVTANIPNCPPPVDSLKCAKLVLFHHGLGGGHLQMIQFANALAARGFIAAAIDFPLHGDRAPCSTAADCNTGGTCDPVPGAAGQGDTVPPGVCSNGNKLTTSLTSAASGRYFISANFFRSRDAFRQDLIDQSALGLALARPPAPLAPQPAADPFRAALLAMSPPVVVDPSAIYFEGISLGGIAGTEVLATNPRVSRGVLSVPGGTLTDVFTNAPAFDAQVDALFLSLGIDRSQIGTDPAVAARYLQTVNVVKWILDPADPVNFAKHVVTSPLPNLLSPTPALQSPKEPWGQLAQGDLVVPNPYNQLLFANGAIPFTHYTSNGGDAPHALLAVSATAQADAALWLLNMTNPGATKNVTDIP
jgi:pimeloyl-ACP methyl ester carboxylesterase